VTKNKVAAFVFFLFVSVPLVQKFKKYILKLNHTCLRYNKNKSLASF